jgi:hypothetical protein
MKEPLLMGATTGLNLLEKRNIPWFYWNSNHGLYSP